MERGILTKQQSIKLFSRLVEIDGHTRALVLVRILLQSSLFRLYLQK